MGGIHLSQLHPVCVQPGHLFLVNLYLNSCARVAFRVLFSVFERSYVCIERMTLAIFGLANPIHPKMPPDSPLSTPEARKLKLTRHIGEQYRQEGPLPLLLRHLGGLPQEHHFAANAQWV